MDLIINLEYEKLMYPLKKEEYQELKNSIKETGQRVNIVCNHKGVIIDGMHRFKICEELNIEPKYEVQNFKHELLERSFIIENVLARRNLTKFQYGEKKLQLLDIRIELRKKKILSPIGDKRTIDTISDDFLGGRTLQKIKRILNDGDENMIEKCRTGEMSIDYAEKDLTNKIQQNTPTPDLPKGKFELIVPDFPWDYGLKLSGSVPYKSLTLEQIKQEFPELPSHDDCILYMWATGPKLKDALDLIEFYGFTYKSQIIWVKTKNKEGFYDDELGNIEVQMGTGFHVYGAHELLLIATKGSPGMPLTKEKITSVFFAERGEHSAKPRSIYRAIERFYPAKKKLEMFSRGADPEDNGTWTYYGDQLD